MFSSPCATPLHNSQRVHFSYVSNGFPFYCLAVPVPSSIFLPSHTLFYLSICAIEPSNSISGRKMSILTLPCFYCWFHWNKYISVCVCIVEMTSTVLFLCSGKSSLTPYRHLRCHFFSSLHSFPANTAAFVPSQSFTLFVMARIILAISNQQTCTHNHIKPIFSNRTTATQISLIRMGKPHK